MKINMNIQGGANSDDEMNGSPDKEEGLGVMQGNLNMTSKKKHISMVMKNPAEFNIESLQNRLTDINEQEELAEKKKLEFENKRKNHYANEFKMA